MKSIISIACVVVLVACVCGQQQVEARPKRSILYAAAAPAVAVATVPVVRTASVVHSSPTSSVVKTEQVHDGVQSSYSYSSEVKTAPAAVVTSHAAVAAAPAVAAISTVHHTVPAYAYASYYHPASYAYYSPYHYVVGK